jgi:hypothetical protein
MELYYVFVARAWILRFSNCVSLVCLYDSHNIQTFMIIGERKRERERERVRERERDRVKKLQRETEYIISE